MNKHTTLKESLALNFQEKFKCVGSECAATCCSGWRISLDKSTYTSYKKNSELAPFVEKFKDKTVSRSSKNYGQIRLLGNGDCPYLDENLLCKVHSGLGKNALSKTCSEFPRTSITSISTVTQHLSLGCPEVVRLLLSEKKVSLENTNHDSKRDGILKIGFHTLLPAIIEFIEISPSPTWKKLLALQTTLLKIKKQSFSEMPYLLGLFKDSLNTINEENLQDPGIFQVRTLFPSVERLSVDGQRNSLTQIRQSAKLYLLKNGGSFESKVKLFVVARELLKRATTKENVDFIDRIAISEIYKNYNNFTNEDSDIIEVFGNVAVTCAMIRFVVICNFGYGNFEISNAKLNKIIALMYRTMGHNSHFLSDIKKDLKAQFGDSNIAGALLLA